MAASTSPLDLVFAMDCTGSMASYIKSATDNIRLVVDEITSKENVSVRLGLIEYRDHPPQDTTFITRVHSFTNSVPEAKKWLEECSAQGGGDGPEAVADALNDALNLPWNSAGAKICILISDAPPHGLVREGDSFPDGCPLGHDPLTIARKMAEKNITLYTAGVEPSILPYRDFFMTLAHITGGQYVPMVDAARLAQMIIAGVREEISIDRLVHSARTDIAREMRKAATDKVNDHEAASRLQRLFSNKKMYVNRMNNTAGAPSREAEECYSKCSDMADIQKQYKQTQSASDTKKTSMDYKLEEDTTVTIEQAKRIVQKAKNWDYSTEELAEERKKVSCKFGSKCRDDSSYHRAKFSHPQNEDHSTRGNHETRSNDHTTRSRDTNSHVRNDDHPTRRNHETRSDDHQGTRCKYGVDCYDHTEYHRTKFSHPQNEDHPTRGNHETRSNDHTTRSRENNSHVRNDDHPTRRNHETRSDNHTTRDRGFNSHVRDDDHQTQCRFGEKCYDHSDYHRTKYSHPSV